MTEKFNPINIWNKHKYADNEQIDQGREQRSSSVDQTGTDAHAQREPVQVLPSDFGSNILNPVEQDSNFKNDSEDMISRNKKPTNYDLFNMKTENKGIHHGTFFGDSNVARRTSRTTLDQEGLHRGNISTLPSAGESRRRSLQQHENDPQSKATPTSLFGRTAAMVTTLGAAGLGVSEQLRDKSKQGNTAMPSTWPESPKVNDNNQFNEPAIHGQSACYKHNDQVCDTITDSDKHSFCDRVQEPSIHGQNPSFYQESNLGSTVTSSVNNPGATTQTIAAAVGDATASVQDANVNNTGASAATVQDVNVNNVNNNKSSSTKEKKSDIWNAGNSMDNKKGVAIGAGLGAAGIGGLLSRKNQINDPKSTDAYQLLGNDPPQHTDSPSSHVDDQSITESMDELPQTWGDQSTPVVLDEQDPLSRPHAADRAFAEHDIGQHHSTVHNANSNAAVPIVDSNVEVHNNVDSNAAINNVDSSADVPVVNSNANQGDSDKSSSTAAGILGGAGIGAAIGSLLGRDKSQSVTNEVTTTTDQNAFGNNEQQAFGGNQAFGNTAVATNVVQDASTHAPIINNTDTTADSDSHLHAHRLDPNDEMYVTSPTAQEETHAVNNDTNKKSHTAAGILGGAGIGAAIGSLFNRGTHNEKESSKDSTGSFDDGDQIIATPPTTHAQIVHNDVDPNSDHAKMGFDKKTTGGILGGAGLGAGVGSLLNRDSHNEKDTTGHPLDNQRQVNAVPNSSEATTHAQIVHNDVDPNADHAKMGFDKKTTGGILGGAGLGAGVGSLLNRDSHNEKDTTGHPLDNQGQVNAVPNSSEATTHAQIVHNDVNPNADHAKMGFDKKTTGGILGGAGLGAGVGSLLNRDSHNEKNTTGHPLDKDDQITAAHPLDEKDQIAAAPAATHAQIVHNDIDPNADHAKMGFDKKSTAGILGGAGLGATVGSMLNRGSHNENSNPAHPLDNGNQPTAAPTATHAQTVHNDVDPNADYAKMGFDKKPGILGGTGTGSLLNRGTHNETGAHRLDTKDQHIAQTGTNQTVPNEAHHDKINKKGILGGAGIGAAVGALLGRKKTNESVDTGVDHGVSEQKAFGGNAAFGSTAPVGILQKPATISPHAKGPVIHNALNSSNVVRNESNVATNEPTVGPRRFSGTMTTPDHHVEKRLAVGGIMGATANAEGRKVLNKLYPENSHWDTTTPIGSRLGEVEVTDQPRRRSSVSETLGNMFGLNKHADAHDTIQEVKTPQPSEHHHSGITSGTAVATGAALTSGAVATTVATSNAVTPKSVTSNTVTPNAVTSNAVAPNAVPPNAMGFNNCSESISSTRATRGEIVPDRSNEVKDRSALSPSKFAHVPDSIQRNPPAAPTHRNSLTQGIKEKAAAATGSISNAVRRLSRRSSIQKDSIHVRHLSDAELYKKQALGSMETSPTNINPAAGGTVEPVQTHLASNGAAAPDLRRGSTSSSDHLKYTGVQKAYARIPGVHTLRPSENVAPVNNESYFIKEESGNLPTVSSLVSGHMENRRGSFQKTVGKIINNGSMQDQGALKEVSGQSKINAYNAAHNKL